MRLERSPQEKAKTHSAPDPRGPGSQDLSEAKACMAKSQAVVCGVSERQPSPLPLLLWLSVPRHADPLVAGCALACVCVGHKCMLLHLPGWISLLATEKKGAVDLKSPSSALNQSRSNFLGLAGFNQH